jgi:hypothetical protein
MPDTIIKSAIERRESLSAKYDDYLRDFSPHALGEDVYGRRAVLAFQYGGGRQGGLPPAGEWCFFNVDGLKGLQPNGDRWRAGRVETKPLHRFRAIDVQV